MALDDDGRQAAEWAALVPGFLRGLGQLTGDARFGDAADAIALVGIMDLAELLARLRSDSVTIDAGTLEISEGVAVELE